MSMLGLVDDGNESLPPPEDYAPRRKISTDPKEVARRAATDELGPFVFLGLLLTMCAVVSYGLG
jgi:hypothetical protein